MLPQAKISPTDRDTCRGCGLAGCLSAGRAPASAQVGLLQSMSNDVDRAEHGAASVAAAFAATRDNSTMQDLELQGCAGSFASRHARGGPSKHRKLGSRVLWMDFSGHVRMPPAPPRLMGMNTGPMQDSAATLEATFSRH